MKGFTLTEVMISLLLGLITMLGFARYSMAASKGFQEDRIRMGVMGNLRMAHKELQDLLQGVDREFFEKFPSYKTISLMPCRKILMVFRLAFHVRRTRTACVLWFGT